MEKRREALYYAVCTPPSNNGVSKSTLGERKRGREKGRERGIREEKRKMMES